MRPDWAIGADNYLKFLKDVSPSRSYILISRDTLHPHNYALVDRETGDKIELSREDLLALRDAINETLNIRVISEAYLPNQYD